MKTQLKVEERSIVVPGQVLAEGMDYLPSKGTYRLKDEIIANRLGLVAVDGKVLKIIPMAGRYLPKKGDTIIGKVIDVLISGWRIDLNTMYESVLSLQEATHDYIKRGEDLTRYFALDDWVVAKIVNVTSQNLVDVSMRGPGLRKLGEGTIIEVSTNKVPRIIGKRGSMVTMLKKGTGCDIVVGQNGVVWMTGEPEMEKLAIRVIRLIEQNSHLQGLTELVKDLLVKETGNEVE